MALIAPISAPTAQGVKVNSDACEIGRAFEEMISEIGLEEMLRLGEVAGLKIRQRNGEMSRRGEHPRCHGRAARRRESCLPRGEDRAGPGRSPEAHEGEKREFSERGPVPSALTPTKRTQGSAFSHALSAS